MSPTDFHIALQEIVLTIFVSEAQVYLYLGMCVCVNLCIQVIVGMYADVAISVGVK